jgi:probable HAF family extracellular repeat protein
MLKRHLIAAAALLACGTLAQAGPAYKVNVVLDTWYYGSIRTINNRGDAVGDIDSNGPLPTIYYDGTSGELVPMRRGSNLWVDVIGSMNNHGVVPFTHVDRSGTGPYTYEAQLFDAATQQYAMLPKPAALGAAGAKSINDAGVVVGSAEYDVGGGSLVKHATAWVNGVPADLGALGASSQANDINTQGTVVGDTGLANGTSSAFLYQGGKMVALGTLGGTSSWARAVNDSNVVVGGSTTGLSTSTAFIYRNGVMEDLGAGAGSEALDINAAGAVVGIAGHKGFLYAGGKVTLLDQLLDPASGWTVREANAINDLGQIGATVCGGADNSCVAAILNPVPEPASYGMLLAGLGIVGAVTRRRHGLS